MSIDTTYFGRDVYHKWSNFFGIVTVFGPAPTNIQGHCFGLHDVDGSFLVNDQHKCDQGGQQVFEISHFSTVYRSWPAPLFLFRTLSAAH